MATGYSTPESLGIVGNPPNIQADGLTAEDPFGVGVVTVDGTAPIVVASNGQDSVLVSYEPAAVGTPGTYAFPQIVVGGTYDQITAVAEGSSVSTIADSQYTAMNPASQSITSGAFTPILYSGGSGSLYTRNPGTINTGLGHFTAPSTGVYLMTGTATFTFSGSAGANCQLVLTDVTNSFDIAENSVISTNPGSATPFAMSVSTTYRLSAAEVVEWQVYQNTGGTLVATGLYFTWTLVCQ